MTLDLSENKFRRFPLLNDLVNLNHLNLNSNDIENFKPDFKGLSCLTLKSLDIGQNQISFPTGQDFFDDFLGRIKKLKNLKVLVVSDNPFVKGHMGGGGGHSDDRTLDQIVAQLPALELINGESAAYYRKMQAQMQKEGAGLK